MRRLATLILSHALFIALSGCGGDDDGGAKAACDECVRPSDAALDSCIISRCPFCDDGDYLGAVVCVARNPSREGEVESCFSECVGCGAGSALTCIPCQDSCDAGAPTRCAPFSGQASCEDGVY